MRNQPLQSLFMSRRRRRYNNRRPYDREPQWPRTPAPQAPPLFDIIFDGIVNALKIVVEKVGQPSQSSRPSPALQGPLSQPGRRARPSRLPYQKVPVLTKGEKALVYPLIKAAKGNYLILCKVRLADVICCPADHGSESHWFNIISRYHVDFVLCDPKTTAPLLVIELDDRSHQSDKQSRRDKWKRPGPPIRRPAHPPSPRQISLRSNRVSRHHPPPDPSHPETNPSAR